MPTYAIGDIQGCYDELCDLMKAISFKPRVDRLWCVGDLVNRGKKSLEVLRFLSDLPQKPIIVLGNHDLHLLAVMSGAFKMNSEDTFYDVLEASDGRALCDWLRCQPLIHHDAELEFTMVHAGILPSWTLQQALNFAAEFELQLRTDPRAAFYQQLYGDEPSFWSDNLTGMDRMRFIANSFTRMRLCYKDGRLDLSEKGKPTEDQNGKVPWFSVPSRVNTTLKILFGHWAALDGKVNVPGLYALDTGCVWGGRLTSLRLEDEKWNSVPARLSIGK